MLMLTIKITELAVLDLDRVSLKLAMEDVEFSESLLVI
jgi:hypothetical protein